MLHPGCRRIDKRKFFTCLYSQNLKRALLANLERLPELKWLELTSRCGKKETTLFLELHIHALHKLEVVDLQHHCTSTVLRALVKKCPCIRRFKAVCAQIQKGEVRLLSQLQRLEHVSINTRKNQSLTEDYAFLICNLPSLQCIECVDVEQVIPVIKKWHLEGKVVPPFSLKSFGDWPQNIKALDTLCSYFPFLESVILEEVKSIRSLRNLKFLKELYVGNVVADDFFKFLAEKTCDLHTLTIVSNISLQNVFKLTNGFHLSTLKDLSIEIYDNVDLEAIQKSLPNLETLIIDFSVRIRSLNERRDGVARAFSKLKRLSILNSFDASHLRYLLSGCEDLEDLEIGDTGDIIIPLIKFGVQGIFDFPRNVVTDQLWMELTKINPMKKLQYLTITSNCLTKKVIPTIVHCFDELKSLTLRGSQWIEELTDEEAYTLLEFLKPFDVELEVINQAIPVQNNEGIEVFSYNMQL